MSDCAILDLNFRNEHTGVHRLLLVSDYLKDHLDANFQGQVHELSPKQNPSAGEMKTKKTQETERYVNLFKYLTKI